MRVTLTGATGLIGTKLVAALLERGDAFPAPARAPERGRENGARVRVVGGAPNPGPAPAAGLAGAEAVVHLAGENVAQRWSDQAKKRILESRRTGTRHLVEGLRELDPRPRVLVSSSAVGYYGKHGDERLTEDASPGSDFLAQVCVAWEREAAAASELDMRVVSVRTGVVLDPAGGALQKMLPFFRAGVGGPVAGGDQYMPWIHVDDIVSLYLAALDGGDWSGPVNGSAPEPVTN